MVRIHVDSCNLAGVACMRVGTLSTYMMPVTTRDQIKVTFHAPPKSSPIPLMLSLNMVLLRSKTAGRVGFLNGCFTQLHTTTPH